MSRLFFEPSRGVILVRKTLSLILLEITVVLFILISTLLPINAMVQGPCSDCHTMHNSQNGLAMTFDGSETPNSHLLRTSSCEGCHAQGGAENIIDFSESKVPQVMHTNGTDLAGGNFAYITGSKGSGASPTKGHNVVALVGQEPTLLVPPGGPVQGGNTHPHSMVERLTCAGLYGCHGSAHVVDPIASMQGAHHTITDESAMGYQKPDGTTVGNSYRFLLGVEGLEVSDWQNRDKDHHNEYKKDNHQSTGPWEPSCYWCHGPDNPWHGNSGEVLAPGSGMQYLCMRCHPAFHSGTSHGGDIVSSPWFRHPSNLSIPDDGEYQYYTTYSVDAPVTRDEIPDSPSNQVTPFRPRGAPFFEVGYDFVSCISCHKAHGTNYPDILRWDYADIEAGNGVSSGKGCIICHTQKDD